MLLLFVGWYRGAIAAYNEGSLKHTIEWLEDNSKDSVVDLLACKMCTSWRFSQPDEDLDATLTELNGEESGDSQEPAVSPPPVAAALPAVSPVANVTGLQLFDQLAASTELLQCPECKESVSATGCHRCAGCHKVMHAFCGIAAPGSVEGFGAQRVCTECQ